MKTISWLVMMALAVLMLSASGCATIESHGEFLSTAPFAQFRTFSFAVPEGPPPGYRTSARSVRILAQMKPLVAEALEKKGYVPAAQGEGDVILACGAGRREVGEEVRMPLPSQVTAISGEEYEDLDFIEGGIVIDAFDRNGGQVWHGAARTEIDPQKPNAERLRQTVDRALARFPAHPTR
jgi:hypothetical protein